jgi:hypothetical protein
VAQRQIARNLIILASLGLLSSPACATQMLSAKDATDPGLSLYSGDTPDEVPTKGAATGTVSRMAAVVPEPGAWLMMLAGFGLLGAMSRRGTPYPQNDAGLL